MARITEVGPDLTRNPSPPAGAFYLADSTTKNLEVILSLQILHLSGDRHFQCRISLLEMSTPFLFTSLSHFHVVHYSQIRSTPTNVTVCLLFQIQFYTPTVMSRLQVVFRGRFV